jgi:hypothetical protein
MEQSSKPREPPQGVVCNSRGQPFLAVLLGGDVGTLQIIVGRGFSRDVKVRNKEGFTAPEVLTHHLLLVHQTDITTDQPFSAHSVQLALCLSKRVPPRRQKLNSTYRPVSSANLCVLCVSALDSSPRAHANRTTISQ